MTQAEVVLLVYCIIWTIAGHWYALRRLDAWQVHRKRSKAAQKAAATRKANGYRVAPKEVSKKAPKEVSKKAPKPRRKEKKALQDRVVTAESAWFKLLNDEDEPDYNEVDPLKHWKPEVRRFDGTAREYAQRDQQEGSV